MGVINKFKNIYRLLIRPVNRFLYYDLQKRKINTTRDGEPLKMGISAVVAMKNEEYTLPFCLNGLIGFADQIIIIDNGSEDKSLQIAKDFKAEFGDLVDVDIIEMPGALLGDCREAGLKATKFQWHLRWDADMVAHTDGQNNMQKLRLKTLADSTPRTIQLPRRNLSGDFFHVHKNKEWDDGEPILMWFNNDINYKEFGKFDTVRVPKYYSQIKESINYYIHCVGLKADSNLIHRFHYFTWRERFNQYNDSNRPKAIESYDDFIKERNTLLFETTDSNSVKYRYQRQFVQNLERLSSFKLEEFPKVLRDEVQKDEPRFEIIYKNKDAFIRLDREDKEARNYTPHNSDVNWSTEDFFKKLLIE
jgi:glycosyltransferase involved in cell wall biosynthesis